MTVVIKNWLNLREQRLITSERVLRAWFPDAATAFFINERNSDMHSEVKF